MLQALLKIILIVGILQGVVAYLVLVERKVAAYIQDRIGPNRVGPKGLLQPIADGLKFIFKQEMLPLGADRVLFLLAPAILFIGATVAFAVVPFGYVMPGPSEQPIELAIAPGLDIGILYVFAVGSLAVYGVILGGWSSNNKYSFLGGLRASAQLISYEIPLGLAVIGVVLLAGSLDLERIIGDQAAGGFWHWNIWAQPLGFGVFVVAAFAEAGRMPFDLQEAEQELVSGYHTEYTGMKWGMFALAEFQHMVLASYLTVLLFFGGWHLPLLAPWTEAGEVTLLGGLGRVVVFLLKVGVMIFFFMWVRWTLPRFRFDQLMSIAWKALIPLGLTNLVVTAIVVEAGAGRLALLIASLAMIAAGIVIAAMLPTRGERAAAMQPTGAAANERR